MENIQEDMEIEDQLSYLTADLVELDSHKQFLERLFSFDSAKWIDVNTLCSNIDHTTNQIESLKATYQGKLQVTWLDYPQAAVGSGYCLIIFYLESLHWSNIALYNKEKLLT